MGPLSLVLEPFLALAKRVPIWAWVLLVLLAWGAWQRHLANAASATLREHDAAVAAQTLAQQQADLARSLAIQKSQKETVDAATTQAAAAAADAARQRTAAERLRARLAARQTDLGPRDPAAAASGPPAAAGSCVPADLFGRVLDAAGQLAAIADQRGVAGQACERAYQALTPP